jgi:adenosine deaminase
LIDFAPLPKIELHLHLDCSLSYAAVSRIDPSVSLQEYQQEFNGPTSGFTNLEEFFKRAPKGTALMQTDRSNTPQYDADPPPLSALAS